MTALATPPKLQFLDSNGAPLVGGKLYTYAAGTTTPQVTYTDFGGGTPNANPVILDSRGEASVWLGTALYKMALYSSTNVLIWTVDNIGGFATLAQLAASGGSNLIGFLQAGTGAVATTVQAKLRESVSVKDFGAVGDGVTDDTVAIQAAINSFPSGQGTIFFPKGIYLVTSTITVAQDRINLIGQGQWVSQIKFVPTANDICIFIGKGGEGTTDAGVIVQCSVKGFSFTSTNTTYKKTALELKDIGECYFDDIAIGSSTQWIGNASIGVRVRGREATSFSNMIVQTNQPFVFAINTSFPTICLDHFTFHNIFSACRGHNETVPVYNETNFFFEPGTNFSNVSFTGYQAWLRGKNGLLYNNSVTAASASSYAMNIQNVRWEGEFGDDDTGHAFYFDHGSVSTIYGITINNAVLGEIGNGFYFKKFENATVKNCQWARVTGTALELVYVNGNESLNVENCFWQTGCTAVIPSQFYAYSAVRSANAAPVYRDGTYASSTASYRRDFLTGGAINEITLTIAATDPTVATLPFKAAATVVAILTDSRGKYAIVGFNSSTKATTLIYNDGTWSITQGTAARLNVYWDAGSTTYKVENKTGVSREMYVQSLGSNQ